MNANERDEIAASVAAHAELGSGYDAAVAEGLVERIGEEIDRRIDKRIGGQEPRPAARASQGPPVYAGPVAPTPSMPAAVPAPAPVPRRSGGPGFWGTVLGLGSMGIGIGATGIVVSHHVNAAAAVFMVLLIWAAIAVINVSHSRRKP